MAWKYENVYPRREDYDIEAEYLEEIALFEKAKKDYYTSREEQIQIERYYG